MSPPSAEHSSVFAAADRLLSLNAQGEEAERLLHGLLESLYRMARTPSRREGLLNWLERYAPSAEAVHPWLLLIRLGENTTATPWQATLGALKRALPLRNARADLYLRTEAARQVHRLTGDPAVADACFRSKERPDPAFRETAVDAVLLRLRLSAVAGDWQEHDRLANGCDRVWIRSAGPEAGWVEVVIAEHAIQRGAYAAALHLLGAEGESTEGRLRFAVLQTRLRALLAVGGDLPGEAIAERILQTADLLEPLLAESLPADEEGQIRAQRTRQLVDRARSGRVSIKPGNEEAALAEIEEALLRGPGRESPEAFLRRLLQWVNLILDRCGPKMAEICENLLSSILVEARRLGLTMVELLARDRRAIVRVRYLGLLKEAIEDAGLAANLCVRLLADNQTLEVERGLRSSLLPAFDRALELLTEASQLDPEKPIPGRQERFGRALLDYAEQLADLALSEARTHIRSGGTKAPGFPVAGGATREKRSEDLQAALRPSEAVLQYLVVGRFLLVFVYGRSFFAWEVQSPEIDGPKSPVPIRTYLEENYLGSWRRIQAERWSRNGIREVEISDVPASARVWNTSEDCLRELADFLIPPGIAAALGGHRVRHLSIVPHDVLYRTPFGSLPWGNSHLGARFSLSLHPTGELAGLSADASRWADKLPLKIGFFKGPGLTHTDAEREALTEAFHRYGEVKRVDTALKDEEERTPFAQAAPRYDIVHLACHGSETRLSLGPEGSSGISLREAARVDLHRCRIAVLQACRTGWMSHRREFPVQGFPQALLDAGAAAVVAPMFPVHDALCPVFASVFGRALRFLPACDALGFTLRILRRHGAVLLADRAETEPFARLPGAFDTYEYRFTGDPDLRLPVGWLRRGLSRIRFAAWLGFKIWYGQPLTANTTRLC